jgi:hypothetical protein
MDKNVNLNLSGLLGRKATGVLLDINGQTVKTTAGEVVGWASGGKGPSRIYILSDYGVIESFYVKEVTVMMGGK